MQDPEQPEFFQLQAFIPRDPEILRCVPGYDPVMSVVPADIPCGENGSVSADELNCVNPASFLV
jgi:hypothetical protein